jgi:transcriptional regulator with XRE-family HTH domain
MADADWFGPRLRALREGAGLTQRQLADRAGVSLEGVAQWERGVREPGWSNVLVLAEALGVDCTAFTQKPADMAPRGPGRPPKAASPTIKGKQPRKAATGQARRRRRRK